MTAIFDLETLFVHQEDLKSIFKINIREKITKPFSNLFFIKYYIFCIMTDGQSKLHTGCSEQQGI